MKLESAKATIEMVFHVVSIFAAVVALGTYRRNARTRHAEWLLSLHQKFYESDRYQRIRRILDYKPEPEFSDLVERVKSGTASDDVDHLYEYLNLFEFVASLGKLGQVTRAEILALFEYYLRNICVHEFLRERLREEGFEKLDELLTDIAPNLDYRRTKWNIAKV